MVNVGGDAQDVLLKQGVQLATVGMATTDIELIIEACGIGPQGPPGVSGNVIHSGDGVPDPELGRVGDYYIDVTGHDLYGPKKAGSGAALPFSHVETYQSANVNGAVAALSDSSNSTGVRISSAEDADWFLHLDESLVGTEEFQVELHFNVISHGAKPFTFRGTLASAEPPDTLTSVELVQGRPVIAGADPGGNVVGTDPLHDGTDATYARSTVTVGSGQVAWVTTQVPAIPDLTLANFQSLDTYVRIKPTVASGATFPVRCALGFQTESFGFISEFDDPGTALSGALALPNNTAAGAVIGHTSLKGNSGTYTDGVSDLIPKLVSGDCQIVFYVLTNPGDPNGAKYTADLLEMSMTLTYGDPPPDTGSAEVDFRGTLSDGYNEYLMVVDQYWMNTHPANPVNPDNASAWSDESVSGVPENYANIVALLGSDAVLHIRGYDGLPYEVDLVYAAISSGTSAWGVPVPLDQGQPGPPGPAGADGLDGSDGSVVLYEQPNDPGAVDEGSMWIDTDSTVVPYVDDPDEGGGSGSGGGTGIQSATVGMAARAKGFVIEQAKPSTVLASAAVIRPDVLYPPDWTGAVEGTFDVDPATPVGTLPITALSPITVTDPAGPGLDPNWRGVLSGGSTVRRAGLEVQVHKVVDAPYLQQSAPVNASTGAWSVDLTALPMTRLGTWAVALVDTATSTQIGEMWPTGLGYAGLRVEHRVVTDNSYVVGTTHAAANGRFWFGQGLTGRKQFRLVRTSDSAVMAEWMPSLGAVRSYLVAPGETGYGESKYTERTFAYDQAIVLFAAIASGDGAWARECVRGLLELQTVGGVSDGAFRFSGLQANPALGDPYYRTGNHAICADALAAYLQAYPQDHSYDYEAALLRALAYLETRRSTSGTTSGLYTGGTGSYASGGEVFDPSTVITWASSEHNFDSYHLLTRAAAVLGDSALTSRANALGDTIEAVLWDPANERFYQGMQASGGDTADPLDCHSWGAMFLAARGKTTQAQSLISDTALAPYRFNRPGGTGYAPARLGDPGYPDAQPTVWAEGTFGVAMAQLAVGDVQRWYKTITDIMPLQNEDGSYPYVTDAVEAYEWTSSKSVIGCAWGMLAVLGHGIWGVEPRDSQLVVDGGGIEVVGGDYEDVRTYGALGDGVHNDGPAIQLAIDAAAASGRVVYLPAGIYIIGQQLNLRTGTTLVGAGRNSIIKLADGHPDNIDMITTAMGDGTRNVTIRDLCVDGNKDTIGTEATWTTETGTWTTCLHLLDVTNLVLEDLLIKNSTIEGVYLGQVHYGSVSRVEASGNGFWRRDASGIHLDGSSHLVVDSSVTNENGFHGIILSAATDNVITDHYAADNGWDGTRIQWSADRNRFEHFISERNSRGLYVMHDSTLNHFTHSTLRNNLYNGFASNNCHGNDLTFTHIEGNGEYAIASVEAGDNQRGYGNTFRNNTLGDYGLAAGSTFTTIAGAGEVI